jgi:2-isopropylmalate synthase
VPHAPRRSLSRGRERSRIVHDWNAKESVRPPVHLELFDETLRDGVQSASVVDPPVAVKIDLLDRMEAVGIAGADLGMPWASERAFDDVVAMAKHLATRRRKLAAACACRTLTEDVAKVAEASQRSGCAITAYTFIGSSPIRQWVESWDLKLLLQRTKEAVSFAVRERLSVAFATEDTTRSSPDQLEPLFRCALDQGATRLVLCDTVGHATPQGTRALVGWTRELLARAGAKGVEIDWHGHNDRGLAIANALAAIEAGAGRVHACGLGIGERVGNVSMDQLLLNLKLLGWLDFDGKALVPYVRAVAEALRYPIPANYPLAGSDAFRTATGVHAAAIAKAAAAGDTWLADRIYSAVPAGEFGQKQTIEIGHLSGMSNVRYWLNLRGLPAPEKVCQEILDRAKARNDTLSEREILEVVEAASRPARRRARG